MSADNVDAIAWQLAHQLGLPPHPDSIHLIATALTTFATQQVAEATKMCACCREQGRCNWGGCRCRRAQEGRMSEPGLSEFERDITRQL